MHRKSTNRDVSPHSDSHGQTAFHTHPHDGPRTDGAVIRWAAMYDLLLKFVLLGGERKLRESTIALAGIRPGEKILDLGCGTGTLAITVKERAAPSVVIYGTDAAPEMVERARRKAERAGVAIDFRVGLAEEIEFPDEIFDVVLSSFMVHHLPGDLKQRAFAEALRVLKPGGRLLVVDFEPPRRRLQRVLLTPFLGHGMMQIDNSQLPHLLRDAGFATVRTGRTEHPLAAYVEGHKPAVAAT